MDGVNSPKRGDAAIFSSRPRKNWLKYQVIFSAENPVSGQQFAWHDGKEPVKSRRG